MNKVTLIGNLSREVKLREGKRPLCFLTVAAKNDFGGTEFIEVKVFGELAESAAAVLGIGDCVEIDAHIQGGRYDKALEKGYPQAIIADTINKVAKTATAAKGVGVKAVETAEGVENE